MPLPSAFTRPSAQAASLPQPLVSSFDERWAAWRPRGAAHDRAVRRSLTIAVPVLGLVLAFVLLAWLAR